MACGPWEGFWVYTIIIQPELTGCSVPDFKAPSGRSGKNRSTSCDENLHQLLFISSTKVFKDSGFPVIFEVARDFAHLYFGFVFSIFVVVVVH